MSPRPAKFSQADVARVLKAARAAGMQVRIDLTSGTAELAENLGLSASSPVTRSEKPAKTLVP